MKINSYHNLTVYSFYIIIAVFLGLYPAKAQTDTALQTANSIIEEMKNTRVKVYGSKCGYDWKNKYDFVSSRAKTLFVGEVISVDDIYEGSSKVTYRIIVPINGVSLDQNTIDIYTPISFKEQGNVRATPLPEKHEIRMVMAYKHRDIFREFKFSYCEEEKIGEEKKSD